MIDTGAFKTAIIDLAVTGQLSAQFHADDSVDEITTALPPLSNKRKKLLGQSFEYGKRATLPDHWRWICLGEISSYGDTPQKAYFDDVSGDTWILDLEDIRSGGQIIKKTHVHGKKFIGDKTVFSEGQVLYSKLRPYLKKILVADEDGISTPELISFDTYGGVIPQYVVYCLLSSFTDRAIEKRSYGIKMPRIDAAFMVNLPIPVPPVSEQQFIVDLVQEAFFQIDNIDKLQAQYADNLTVLKGKLIDAAIQGKLTEQLPEDGTAEELLQHIEIEKPSEGKRGKGNNDKVLQPITMDEIPFEIPENWRWCRLADIASTNIGLTYHPEDIVDDGTIVVRSSNIVNSRMDYADLVKVRCPIRENQYLNTNDIVICARNGSKSLVGKCAIYEGEPGTVSFGAFMAVLRTPFYKYVFYYLHTDAFRRYFHSDDSKQINQVTQGILKEAIIPLPPLAEQERIVAKLDAAISLLEARE